MINRVLIDVTTLELETPKPKGSAGRPRLYNDTHADLQLFLERINGYFQWVDDNPYKTQHIFHNKGETVKDTTEVPRPYTIQALELFIGMVHSRMGDYEKRKGFRAIITQAKRIIYENKFSGAASGFFNSNIIAKDLGLASKKELELKQGGPSSFIVQLATKEGQAGHEE